MSSLSHTHRIFIADNWLYTATTYKTGDIIYDGNCALVVNHVSFVIEKRSGVWCDH